jgi:hypothetical protein
VSTATSESRVYGGTVPQPLPAAFRWVVALRAAPLWAGLAVGAASVAAGLALTGISDSLVTLGHVMYALYWVWLPLATRALVRGTAQDVAALGPALSSTQEGVSRLGERVFRAAGRALPASVGFGVVVAIFDVWLIFGMPGRWQHDASIAGYVVVRELVLCIAIFAVIGWAVAAAHALSRATRDHARVDLLDPSALAPLGRCGTRLALWWLLMVGITLVILFAPHVSASLIEKVLLMTLGYAAMAVVALLIPTWGAHRVIADAKAAELASVRAQLHRVHDTGDDTRVPGLVAWEQRIESVSEWPVDARSARRLGLYTLIPLASWVGGALVERAVNALLG